MKPKPNPVDLPASLETMLLDGALTAGTENDGLQTAAPKLKAPAADPEPKPVKPLNAPVCTHVKISVLKSSHGH